MVETIERIADEHSSALARHAAIIMKSLINLLLEVVNQCSTLDIDNAEKDVPKAEIRAKLCRNTRVMSENCDHRVLLFTLQHTLCHMDILIHQLKKRTMRRTSASPKTPLLHHKRPMKLE